MCHFFGLMALLAVGEERGNPHSQIGDGGRSLVQMAPGGQEKRTSL